MKRRGDATLGARDTALLAFGIGTGTIQYVAYALGQVPPNKWLLLLTIGTLLGSTVLSNVLDAILRLIPGVNVDRPSRGSEDDA